VPYVHGAWIRIRAMTPILVVDDEADLCATYERLLRRHGYRIETTGTRAEALALLEHEAFALVISDLRLPDGHGLDLVHVARRMRAPTPVIIVTGFGSREIQEAVLAAGAAGYLQKPFTAAALTCLVGSIVAA
jgi:two-component system, NtrC family, response regulator PilR